MNFSSFLLASPWISSGNFQPLLKFGPQQTPGLPGEPELRGASEAGTSWSSRSLGRVKNFPVKGGPAVGRMACFLFGAGGVIFIAWKILGGITVFFPNKTQGKSQNFLKKLQAGKFATKTSFTLDDWRKKTVEVILVASASAVLGRILVELFVGRGMLSTVRAGNVSFDKP